MGIQLYLENGYLDFTYINSKPSWLNVIIGARQVGKTYGALHCMLKYDLQHVLLRRTTAELDTITASLDLNPYKVFEPVYRVGLFRSGKKICRVCDYDLDDEGKPILGKQRGIATSLSEIAHVRGFNGSPFTDLVFDEFIPEKGVVTRSTEGDAFLNAYTTINGNRELKGEKPLRAWLLANTNNINSPVLEALNLTDDILRMRAKGKEELLTEKGVYILQPNSTAITKQRAETAMMQQLSRNSEFYGMAIDNEFSYDRSPYVKQRSLKGLIPKWSFGDFMFTWGTENGFYICRSPFKSVHADKFKDDRTGKEQLQLAWGIMKQYYYAEMVTFSDLRLLATFKNIFNID